MVYWLDMQMHKLMEKFWLISLIHPWWQLYAGLDFGVGARAKILGIEIFDFETNVFELRWLLAQASGNLLDPCPGLPSITDSRDGKVYNTVLIGNQCWLRENLNIGTRINGSQTQANNGTIEKYCYDDNPANCNTYGGLYQWDEAMQYVTTEGTKGICPTGWHIPTLTEFMTLGGSVVGDANALKAVLQGTGNGAGTNTSGFTALLAGDRFDNGYFENLAIDAYFWSSKQYDATGAGNLNLYYDDDIIYLGTQR